MKALLNGGKVFGGLELVEKVLVRAGVLNDEFGPAIDGEDGGALAGLDFLEDALRIALEIGDRVDVFEINHEIS